MLKKIIAVTVALLLTANAMLFYALSNAVFALAMLSAAVLYLGIRWQNAIALSVSLAVTTVVLAVVFQLLMTSESVYYRPHEMFSRADGRYENNVRFEMAMPHGDLKAMALYTDVPLEPRTVIFNTDSLGYRNTEDYRGQQYLMVGDSFIVGNGVSQPDILTEQLYRKHGIDSYNLGFPGGVKDYTVRLQAFRKQTRSDAKAVWFLFEGNDFPIKTQAEPVAEAPASSPVSDAWNAYKRIIGKTDMYRFIYSATRRIYAVSIKKKEEQVEVRDLNGVPVAFYKAYIHDTEREDLPVNIETETLLAQFRDRIEHIFFVPTKYRVYYHHLHSGQADKEHILPDRQWQYVQLLGARLGIATTNLTPALVRRSDELLQSGSFTYWRDDTHWSAHGIAVAAEVVAQVLSSPGETHDQALRQ